MISREREGWTLSFSGIVPSFNMGALILLVSCLISTLELSNQLWTYSKVYIEIIVVTLNLTFDLATKIKVIKWLIFQLVNDFIWFNIDCRAQESIVDI